MPRTDITNHGHPLSPEPPLNHAAPEATASPAPASVKIQIELSEEEAACWWADVTWNGKALRRIDSIVRDHVLQQIHKVMRQTIRPDREQAVEDYRKHHPH